jgi:hypothetical protein
MDSPRCPEHGRMVLDLARGKLDDGDAVRAEEIRRACSVCSGWWRAHLEGEAALVVDSAVSEAWTRVSPPLRRRLRPWLAAAAAAAFALTVFWAQDLGRSSHRPPATVAEAVPIVAADLDADRGRGEVLRNVEPLRRAAPENLPASVKPAPARLNAGASETGHVLGAVFGADGSTADAGSLARALGTPRHRDS